VQRSWRRIDGAGGIDVARGMRRGGGRIKTGGIEVISREK
jgi:hypothetical protein